MISTAWCRGCRLWDQMEGRQLSAHDPSAGGPVPRDAAPASTGKAAGAVRAAGAPEKEAASTAAAVPAALPAVGTSCDALLYRLAQHQSMCRHAGTSVYSYVTNLLWLICPMRQHMLQLCKQRSS